MTFSSLILALAVSHAPHTCGADCDWRADLPPNVLAVIQKVDDQKAADQKVDEKAEKAKKQHEKDVQDDIKMGDEYAKEVDKELKPSENKEFIEKVAKIGKELGDIANEENPEVSWGDPRHSVFPYKFKVVKGDDVNAFSIPGGNLYVFEGLINFAESDDELAGVLAHEVAHAAFRHVAWMRKSSSKLDLLQIPLLIISIMAAGGDAGAVAQAGLYGTQAAKSGWSQKAETSADYGALQYMSKSHYNPVGVLTLMERLAYKERANAQIDWGIFRTHPPSPERANFILKKLVELNIPVRRSQVTKSLSASTKIGPDGIDLWFGTIRLYTFRGENAIERSEIAEERVNRFLDGVPALYELSRDVYKLKGNNRELFEVKQDDLLVDEDLDSIFKATQSRIQSVMFDLSTRLWPRPDLNVDKF